MFTPGTSDSEARIRWPVESGAPLSLVPGVI
ncbi:MAG: hypothetical protein JWM97_472, partial [Phycisphaerales bacterium]|nr:hypothetical protein [Phycisphaerales bacterium]